MSCARTCSLCSAKNLTDAQYDAVYEINLDYLMSVNGRDDVFGTWWNRRNNDLRFVLTAWQYDKYMAQNYFYRPLTWNTGTFTFSIYSHYTNRSHFYKARPTVFVSYKGGNNRKADRFYADRRVVKPAPKAPAAKPAPKPTNNATWRNTGNAHHNATAMNNGHSRSATSGNALLAKNVNRQIAQNSNTGKKTNHFGGRR